jgi:hypothetical protein
MPGFWLSAQLLFVLPNGVLSLCDAMVEGPLLAESGPSLNPALTRQLSRWLLKTEVLEDGQEKCLLPVSYQLP